MNSPCDRIARSLVLKVGDVHGVISTPTIDHTSRAAIVLRFSRLIVIKISTYNYIRFTFFALEGTRPFLLAGTPFFSPKAPSAPQDLQ